MSFDVYAIGNALVDSEFQVDTDFFKGFEQEKGLMTLVDTNRRSELWSKVGKDPIKKQCGGSAANSVIAVSQFGGTSFYAYKVADDETGQFYKSDMLNNGVNFSLENVNSDQPTGTCTVFITPDADRTMYTHLGATTEFSEEDLRVQALKESNYLYVEGYLVTGEQALKAALTSIEQAREFSKKISLTLSDPGIVAGFKDQFKKLMSEKIDLLFCNEEEAMSLTESDNIHSAFEGLKKYSDKFVITRGKEGALIFDGAEKVFIEGFEAKAINTNGAGDMFAGAYLYGINNGMDDKQAAKLGSFMASKVVEVFGPRLTKEQADAYLKEFKGL